MILHSQITAELPQTFPKPCIWDVFVNCRVLFLTGPPLKHILHCHSAPPNMQVKNSALKHSESSSDSDNPISATELQILIIGYDSFSKNCWNAHHLNMPSSFEKTFNKKLPN